MNPTPEQILEHALALDGHHRKELLLQLSESLGLPVGVGTGARGLGIAGAGAGTGSGAEARAGAAPGTAPGAKPGTGPGTGSEPEPRAGAVAGAVTEREHTSPGQPRLYTEFASWWHLLSAPSEYTEEAKVYASLLVAGCEEPPRTVLELGSGGGNNASHLRTRFDMTLVDQSPEMLAMSRGLNPGCEHLEGDMRSVRLGREFDCVFVHDAIVYMLTESDLRRAIETAFVHCRPGGVSLFAPDLIRENFRPSTGYGGHDGQAGDDRSVRYLSWTWDPDPSDTTYIADYAYMFRDAEGSIRLEHDRHVEGLFPRADWLRFLFEAGFRPSVVPFEHSEIEYGTCELFVARKPAT